MPAIPISDTLSTLFPEMDRERPDSADGIRPQPRQKGRAADWRGQMARAYAYAASRARDEDEARRLEEAYAAAMEEGPDFTSYRRESGFQEPPRLSIDRNAAARIRFQLVAIFRGSWKVKDKGQHAGLIKHSVIEVFDALMRLAFKHGRLFPSLVGIAYLAGRSKQTVVNALKVLEQFGFITVIRRIKRIRTALGFKTVQDTNAYTIQEPNPFGQMAFRVFFGGSESRKSAARKPEFLSKKEDRRNSRPTMPWEGSWSDLRTQWEAG